MTPGPAGSFERRSAPATVRPQEQRPHRCAARDASPFAARDINKRFEDMNKRFTSLQWMGTVAFVVLGIVISVVGLQ